jgi:rhamnosyltransferase
VPHDENNNPHEWFRPQDLASFKEINCSIDVFEKMSPIDQRSLCGWDNVISLYRRTSLIELPFENIIFGEDMLWAKMALIRGWTIGYDHSCTVNHYHYSFGDYTYQRTLIAKLFILKCFDYFDNRTFGFRDYLLIIYRNFKWKSHIRWVSHNWKILYQYNKATLELFKHIKNNTIEKLESDFKLNIPIGKT